MFFYSSYDYQTDEELNNDQTDEELKDNKMDEELNNDQADEELNNDQADKKLKDNTGAESPKEASCQTYEELITTTYITEATFENDMNCVMIPYIEHQKYVKYVNYSNYITELNFPKTEFIIYNNKTFKVIPNTGLNCRDKRMLINKKHLENSYSSINISEFGKIPEATKVVLTEFRTKNKYFTKDNFNDFLQDIFIKEISGHAILYNNEGMNKTFNDYEFKFNVSIEDLNKKYKCKIIKITDKTEIIISDDLKSSNIIDNIIELNNDDIMDITIDKHEPYNNKTNTFDLDNIYKLLSGCNLSGNDTCLKDKDEKYLLKDTIINTLYEKCKNTHIIFRINDTISLLINGVKYFVIINGINKNTKLNNGFMLTNKPNINIKSNNVTIYDELILLSTDDEITLIPTSNDKILLKNDVLLCINRDIFSNELINSTEFSIYSNYEQCKMKISSIYLKTYKLSKNKYYIYKCIDELPQIKLINNENSNTYIVESIDEKVIESITLNVINKGTAMYELNLKDIKYHLYTFVQQHIINLSKRLNIKTYSNLSFFVESVTYLDGTKCNSTVIGKFTKETNVNIVKQNIGTDIYIIDENMYKSNILDLNNLKNLELILEKQGVYGMSENNIKTLIDVLIMRTNIVDESIYDLIEPIKGIMLYGPPGTGKTSLATKLTKVLGVNNSNVQFISAPEIKSKYHGESEKNIRDIFSSAEEAFKRLGHLSPLYVIIIDEIDAMLSSRNSNENSNVSNSIVNQFLTKMDGFNKLTNLLIIGITNRLEIIDEAALRSGRFTCKIHLGKPSILEREKILIGYHHKIRGTNYIDNLSNFNYKYISEITEGFTGADIKEIFSKAITKYLNNKINGQEELAINQNDIINIINQFNNNHI